MSWMKRDVEPSPSSTPTPGRDDWSDHWQAYAESASRNPAQQMRHALILDCMRSAETPVDLLLDIGSGQGDFLSKAVRAGVARHYAGFELSEAGVGISRQKVPGAVFHQVDLVSPPPEISRYAGRADLIVCSDVIEHVDDPIAFCQIIREYLSPGGQVILTVPGGPMSAFDRHIGHRAHFTKASAPRVLEAAGFTVRTVVRAGFPFFNLYRLVVI